jgi:hypothetical protein
MRTEVAINRFFMVVTGFFEIFAACSAASPSIYGPRLCPISNKLLKRLISQNLRGSLAVKTKGNWFGFWKVWGGYLTCLGAGRLAGGNR